MAEPALRLTDQLAGGNGWDDLGYRAAVRGGRVMPGLKPAERAVLWAYREHANRDGEAWPSNESLAVATGLTERAVQEARKGLVTKGRLAEAAVQDKPTKVMVVLIPLPRGGGGCTVVHPGGAQAFTPGVHGGSPEAPNEATKEELAGRAGDSPPGVSDASGGAVVSGGTLFERPGYDADAMRLMVDLGVKLEVARGLVVRHRPTAAELGAVVEVMDAMDRASELGLKDANGKAIEAVRSRARFVEGAVRSGTYGRPRWMQRMEDEVARKAKRAVEQCNRDSALERYWASLTAAEQVEAERLALPKVPPARRSDAREVRGTALMLAKQRRWGDWQEVMS